MDWDWIAAETKDYKDRTENAEKERDLWKTEALLARVVFNRFLTMETNKTQETIDLFVKAKVEYGKAKEENESYLLPSSSKSEKLTDPPVD